MEFPRLVYRATSVKHFIHESVETEEEHAAALKAGWSDSVPAALMNFGIPSEDNSPPTREEMEAKARELNIKFDGRTTDKKLLSMIEESISGLE